MSEERLRDEDWHDEDWRRAFASHHGALPDEEHPPAETLWALASGELVAPDSRGVVDHVSRCAACAEDLRVTRELVAESSAGRRDTQPEPSRQDPRRRAASPWTSRWSQGLAAAAVLVLAVTGGLWLSNDPDPVVRQADDLEIRSLLPDDAELTPEAAVLRWALPEKLAAETEGARYDVVVTTEDLVPVAEERGLDVAELRLDTGALARLPDAVLLWRVDAVLADGSRVSSPTFRTRWRNSK